MIVFLWWAVEDSNLRSRKAPDLQSGVIAAIRTAHDLDYFTSF